MREREGLMGRRSGGAEGGLSRENADMSRTHEDNMLKIRSPRRFPLTTRSWVNPNSSRHLSRVSRAYTRKACERLQISRVPLTNSFRQRVAARDAKYTGALRAGFTFPPLSSLSMYSLLWVMHMKLCVLYWLRLSMNEPGNAGPWMLPIDQFEN